jgi:aryl-alcohol dehydrogenase-like predicted oxidoreductase
VQPDVFPRVFEVVQELKEVAAKYGKTPGQTGLRWRVCAGFLTRRVSRRLLWAFPNLSNLMRI